MRQNAIYNLSTGLLSVMVMSMPLKAVSQGLIEIRDPLRGVTFYSIQISSDPMNKLQTRDNLFTEQDRMTLGISALFFDESKTVDEFVLWFHHEGPRSRFSTAASNPLTIRFSDMDAQPRLLHITNSGQAENSGMLTEKLEFTLSAQEFLPIMDSDSVSLELATAVGTIVKTLGYADIDAIRQFDTRVRKRHTWMNTAKTGQSYISTSYYFQ